MKKITRNIATLMVLTVAGTTVATAQVVEQKVGDNNLIMNQNAVLEIESTNRGLLLPRLELTATDNFAPLTAHVEGMTIYNTATAGTGATAVTPGYYYNDGAKWVRIVNSTDIKTEPWFDQATNIEATDNTQNIYQMGSVAIGKDEADVKLDVAGDFKSEYTDSDGWIKGISNNVQSIFGDGIIGMYWADNENFTMGQGNYDQISLPGNPIVGGFSLSTKRDTPDGPNAGTISAQNTAFGMTIDMQSTNAADDRASRISLGGIYRVNLTDKTTGGLGAGITISDHRGVQFRFDDATGATEGVYDFPRNNGTAGQVLTTDGSLMAQLSWADASTLVDINEPWKIQNTDTEATDNEQDIYQQGKVAVGFDEDDVVSEKQFEVKGDMKSEFVDTDDYVYGFQTARPGLDPSTKENLMYVTDNENLSAANHYSMIGVNKDNATFIAMDKTGAHDKAAIITASNIPGGSGGVVGMASETTDGGKYVNVGGLTWTDEVEGAIQTRQTVTGEDIEMDLLVRPKTGISFKHQGPTGYGAYTFPTNSPTEGQVLVGSATTGGSVVGRQLEWKDVSDLVEVPTEPWRVQGTTNEATANTENIFQLGSVAIGANTIPSITTGSGTVNPMLHVAGDVSTTGKFYTTSSVYADYVFEKYFDGTSEINDEYEFNSLDYIKAFIEENKHLPGVTKIDDLLKNENGYMFDMTELSIQQLEKIEELFIHVIEQNQQIIELKNQVEDNNKRLEILENLLLENNSK